jgi:phage terminase large subunit-like protein
MSLVVDEVLADEQYLEQEFAKLSPIQRAVVTWQLKWMKQAHKHQIEPPGDWWNVWLMLAGRGAGKTRAAAETLAQWAWEEPNTRWLVSAPTSGDIRGTCFEGDSGLLAVIPEALIADYNKSLHELRLINGSFIKGIAASEPERFRGGQWHGAWLDELAAWDYLQDAWDMIMFAVRLGKKTRIIASTTPKPKPLIMELLGREGDDVTVTKASTYVNVANLAPSFQKQILQYEGTKLGRQEIHAEIIDPEEGGIVKRDWFRLWPDGKAFPKLEFILQSYDCATSEKTHNDPSGQITLGVFKPLDGGMSVMVLDCWNEHLQYPDLRPKVINEYETVYGEGKTRKLVDLVLVEDKSAGISLIQDLQRAHIPVHAYNPGKADKIQRLSIVANIIKAGRVWVPESSVRKGFVKDWAEGMISQICSFPEGTVHDEYVDCISQGLRYLRDAGWISIDAPPREEIEQEDITDAEIYNMRQRGNPYTA